MLGNTIRPWAVIRAQTHAFFLCLLNHRQSLTISTSYHFRGVGKFLPCWSEHYHFIKVIDGPVVYIEDAPGVWDKISSIATAWDTKNKSAECV